jgi:hypothetical protein
MTEILRCATCKNTKCWLCKGNVYYDRVMALNTCEAREHKQDIGLFRDFVKLNGCVLHTDFKIPIEKFITIISDRIVELKDMLHKNPHDPVLLALIGENQAMWAQLKLLEENK